MHWLRGSFAAITVVCLVTFYHYKPNYHRLMSDTTVLPAMQIAPTEEGSIPFVVGGETYQTWYRVFGDLKTSKLRPVVVVHGGPGMCHDYLLPISDLATAPYNRPVIFYDQVGNSRSTHLPDKSVEFWTITLFLDELENLLRFFKIEDDYDFLGHSWGAQLGSEFEIQRHPKGMKHLILANGLPDMDDWDKSNGQLIEPFPMEVKQALMNGMKDRAKFLWALQQYEKKHACLVQPAPKEVASALGVLFGPDGDPTVDRAMSGPGGTLKGWSVKDRLDQVRKPTLVINGKFDMAQDWIVEPFVTRIPGARWIKYEKSSHMPHWEERETYMKDVDAFLNE